MFRHLPLLSLVTLSLALMAAPVRADEILWRSGKNQYVKLVAQDDSLGPDTPANDHPAEIDAQKLRLALGELRFRDEGFLSGEEIFPVFSTAQRRTLAQMTSEGLARATPGQELIFALAGKRGGDPDRTFSFSGHTYTAGRVFYRDGRLQLLFGDFHRPRDKGQESMAGQFGEYEISYRFRHGRRAGPKGLYAMKHPLLKVAGVTPMELDGKRRLDWLSIDVEATSARALAEQRRKEQRAPSARNVEQATLERLEMRAEMARMRKEMRALSGDTRGGAATTDLRRRIQTLEQLRQDGLITEQEYQKKRSEILGDI